MLGRSRSPAHRRGQLRSQRRSAPSMNPQNLPSLLQTALPMAWPRPPPASQPMAMQRNSSAGSGPRARRARGTSGGTARARTSRHPRGRGARTATVTPATRGTWGLGPGGMIRGRTSCSGSNAPRTRKLGCAGRDMMTRVKTVSQISAPILFELCLCPLSSLPAHAPVFSKAACHR